MASIANPYKIRVSWLLVPPIFTPKKLNVLHLTLQDIRKWATMFVPQRFQPRCPWRCAEKWGDFKDI